MPDRRKASCGFNIGKDDIAGKRLASSVQGLSLVSDAVGSDKHILPRWWPLGGLEQDAELRGPAHRAPAAA